MRVTAVHIPYSSDTKDATRSEDERVDVVKSRAFFFIICDDHVLTIYEHGGITFSFISLVWNFAEDLTQCMLYPVPCSEGICILSESVGGCR